MGSIYSEPSLWCPSNVRHRKSNFRPILIVYKIKVAVGGNSVVKSIGTRQIKSTATGTRIITRWMDDGKHGLAGLQLVRANIRLE